MIRESRAETAEVRAKSGNPLEESGRSDGAKESGEAAKGATGGGREGGAYGQSNGIGGRLGN